LHTNKHAQKKHTNGGTLLVHTVLSPANSQSLLMHIKNSVIDN